MKNVVVLMLSLCLMACGLAFGGTGSGVEKKPLVKMEKIVKEKTFIVVDVSKIPSYCNFTSPAENIFSRFSIRRTKSNSYSYNLSRAIYKKDKNIVQANFSKNIYRGQRLLRVV